MVPARPLRSAPVLSPATAKALVATFANDASGFASSSSDSPDSLYSNGSPTFPDPEQGREFDDAFEYDEQELDEFSHHTHSAGEYDDAVDHSVGSQSGWGRWPESNPTFWSTSSRDSKSVGSGTGGRGSIISISPRGSVSGSRKGSLPGRSKLNDERRDSDPSLLGFDLAMQRRRSSTRSFSSLVQGRRRSSVLSYQSNTSFLSYQSNTSSTLDPAEEARLRHIASMDLLGRRFSEVVEITCPSSEDEQEDTNLVRQAFSRWSPDTPSASESDMSEVHTAPFGSTPVLAPPPSEPIILSNFPLASVAIERLQVGTPSEVSSTASSPALSSQVSHRLHNHFITTPPPPMEPVSLLRNRNRPIFPRAATDYQFPPQRTGVPPGAAIPRPVLHRSVSQPLVPSSLATDRSSTSPFSAPDSSLAPESRAIPINYSNVTGSFPLARPTPLGTSPLRAVTRRESAVSDTEASRRSSVVTTAERRISNATSADIFDRPSSLSREVVDSARRESGTRRVPASRRDSTCRRDSGSRRDSADRRSSVASSSRKGSVVSLRKGSVDTRRSSIASRKGSVVSVSEFAYLAPQIIIEAPPSTSPSVSVPRGGPFDRRPALPTLEFPPVFSLSSSRLQAAPNTPYTPAPRFNPMDSFLGTTSPAHSMPNTPNTILAPLSPTTDADTTPVISHQSPRPMMDRGRPISPPEFRNSFAPRSSRAPSPKSTFSPLPSTTPTPVVRHDDRMSPTVAPFPTTTTTVPVPNLSGTRVAGGGVSRKAAPKLSSEEMLCEAAKDQTLRAAREEQFNRQFQRRAAFTTEEEALLRGAHAHLRNDAYDAVGRQPTMTMVRQLAGDWNDDSHGSSSPSSPVRPKASRQTTLPAELDPKPRSNKELNRRSAQAIIVSTRSSSPSSSDKSVGKRSSLTFVNGLPHRPTVARSVSTSSFTRFFHSRTRSNSDLKQASKLGVTTPSASGSDSSGSDRTLVDIRDLSKQSSDEKI